MKHFTIVYSLHHSAEYWPSKEVFVAENGMDDADLSRLVSTMFYTSIHFSCNPDAEGFAQWVHKHSDVIRAWLFGTEDVDTSIEIDSLGSWEDGIQTPEIFNLHSDRSKVRNIGLSIPGGSKHDTIWFQFVDRDGDVEKNKDELQSLSRQELIDKLAVALL